MGKTQIDSTKTQCKIFPKLSFSEIACNQWNQKSGEKKSLDWSYTSIIIRPPRLHVPSLLEGTVVTVSSHFLAIKFEGYFSFNTMCGVAALRDN